MAGYNLGGNGTCSDCSYCKFPGYPYCTKHGCQVSRDDCCADYESPIGALARRIIEEERQGQQNQKPSEPHEVQAPVPDEMETELSPILRYLGVGLLILCIMAVRSLTG